MDVAWTIHWTLKRVQLAHSYTAVGYSLEVGLGALSNKQRLAQGYRRHVSLHGLANRHIVDRGGELLEPTLNRNSQKHDSLHQTTLMSVGWLRLFTEVSGESRGMKL